MKNIVNEKNLAIESSYGYMNIHLSLLDNAIKENDRDNINFQINQLSKIRNRLIKLGYFD